VGESAEAASAVMVTCANNMYVRMMSVERGQPSHIRGDWLAWLVDVTDLVPVQLGRSSRRGLGGVEEVNVAVERDGGEGAGVQPEEAVLHVPQLRLVEGVGRLERARGQVPHLCKWIMG
jgi:hypothetical protein